jgi:MbtH protein
MQDVHTEWSIYAVVTNAEGQYSIWPSARPLPSGWFTEGTSGTKEECLDHIKTAWVDMRPVSLRES